MSASCRITGCKGGVPPQLEPQGLCVVHFTLSVEQRCAEMRLETGRGLATPERQAEITRWLAEQGEILAHVATSGVPLPDALKARILSTFLTLMNLRESVDRAALRGVAPARKGEPRSDS